MGTGTGTAVDSGQVLRLQMLGVPQLHWQGQEVAALLSARQRALLFVLAVETRPVSRGRMAVLLWPERAEDVARANLRVALCRLRQTLPGVLCSDARGLSLAPGHSGTDLERLRQACSAPRQGDRTTPDLPSQPAPLLEGFELEGCSDAFGHWLHAHREQVGRQWADLLRRQLLAHEAAGLSEQAIDTARRLLALDVADESAHMALMRLLAGTGRRWAALEQYESCRQALAERLGARPSTQCYALYVRIHAQAAPPAAHPGLPERAPAPPALQQGPVVPQDDHSLALLGREAELTRLGQLLSRRGGCWVALHGPMGMGKTALARELCAGLQARGSHDLCWIDANTCGEDWPLLLLGLARGWGQAGLAPSSRQRLIVLDGVADLPLLRTQAVQGPLGELAALTAPTDAPPCAQAGRLQVLTTSRRPLPLASVWRLALEEVAEAPAQALLMRHCQARPGTRPPLSPELARWVADWVLPHTGGWPWALEVAGRMLSLMGAQALQAQLQHCSPCGPRPQGGTSLHWLDEASAALGIGQPLGLALEVHEAWLALPLQVQAAVQALAPLGPSFGAAEALRCGATLGNLQLLREHGWLQPQGVGRLRWPVWCRTTVASLGGHCTDLDPDEGPCAGVAWPPAPGPLQPDREEVGAGFMALTQWPAPNGAPH